MFSERKPVKLINEIKWNEAYYLIRGNDGQIPAWHFIVVSYNKVTDLLDQKAGGSINVTNFGTIMRYRDENDHVNNLLGWGRNPSRSLLRWISANCGKTI